jgi:hypothetical protein
VTTSSRVGRLIMSAPIDLIKRIALSRAGPIVARAAWHRAARSSRSLRPVSGCAAAATVSATSRGRCGIVAVAAWAATSARSCSTSTAPALSRPCRPSPARALPPTSADGRADRERRRCRKLRARATSPGRLAVAAAEAARRLDCADVSPEGARHRLSAAGHARVLAADKAQASPGLIAYGV